jgi:hypothetical protein
LGSHTQQDYPRNIELVEHKCSATGGNRPGIFVFQAMELRHLRVVAPHRRIMATHPHGHQPPNPRIRPAVPFRGQPSSHNRRNVKVPTGKVFTFNGNDDTVDEFQNFSSAGDFQGGLERSRGQWWSRGVQSGPGMSRTVQGGGLVFW